MSTAAVYIVTPFKSGRKGALAAGEPRRCASEAEASRAADAMIRARGVIVLREEEDPQVDYFGEPSVIVRRGEVPDVSFD